MNRRQYTAIYADIESARVVGDDLLGTMRSLLSNLASRARKTVGDEFLRRQGQDILEEVGPTTALYEALSRWAEENPVPLLLLFDEVDSLREAPLLSLLSQLRTGYLERPQQFPQSVILCGVRDVQGYPIPTGSPFNIVDRSLRLGDFSEAEVRELLDQHTQETGQTFTEEAQAEVWAATRGQPWLVNALAEGACFKTDAGHNRSRAITVDDIAAAREHLILRRPTHFRHIADRLKEPRVRRVIDPILAGRNRLESLSGDDLHYVRDLGLTA